MHLLFIIITFYIIIALFKSKSTYKLASLCKYQRYRVKKNRGCNLPCFLKSNYTFPKEHKYYCGKTKIYSFNNSTINFNENVTMIEYWIMNNKLFKNIKKFKV